VISRKGLAKIKKLFEKIDKVINEETQMEYSKKATKGDFADMKNSLNTLYLKIYAKHNSLKHSSNLDEIIARIKRIERHLNLKQM
jgi:hypothetical protein